MASESLDSLTVSRISVSKTTTSRIVSITDTMNKNGQDYIPVRTVINQEKTQNFQNRIYTLKRKVKISETKSKKVVYETHYIPSQYITCMFEINIRTEYQQQMNR